MSLSPIATASLRTLRPLALGLKARGVAIDALFLEAGIRPDALGDPDARVPATVVHELWHRAAQVGGDIDFGLRTAQMIKPGSFDVLDYVCRNCATVGAGMQLYCRYTPLLHDRISASVEVGPARVCLRHTLVDGTKLPRQYAEFIVASLVVIVRQASGHDVVPLQTHFIHGAPSDTSTHRALFRSPIAFNAEFNGFELSRDDFDRPLREAQPGLLTVLERHAEHLLGNSPRPSDLITQIRAAIVAALRSGSVSASEVAGALGMSDRTLRRRLDASDTTYQQQLDGVRRELATGYLEEKELSADEVALLLGFSDRSTFIRAFRRWTGQSPAEYRNEVVAARGRA